MVSAFRQANPLLVPPWIDWQVDLVINRMKEVAQWGRPIVTGLEIVVHNAGSPDNLRAAADVLDSKIGEPADALSKTVTLGKFNSTLSENWDDGSASERYAHAIDGRDIAVKDIKMHASSIGQGLRDLADAIESFYLGLAQAIAGLVAALLSLIVAAATVATVVGLVVGILAALASLVAAIIGIVQFIVAMTQSMDKVQLSLSTTIPEWVRGGK
jgi:hypothetical protein